MKASSLHLLRIQLTACGLLPAGRVYNVECNTSIAAVVMAYSYERETTNKNKLDLAFNNLLMNLANVV